MPEENNLKAIRELADAIVETVQESMPGGIPSGHLYSSLMDIISLDTYYTMIEILQEQGRVKVSNDLLTIPK